MIELTAEHYGRLSKHLDDVTFNHLFARAVIEGSVSGRAYVDEVDHPRTYYIVHRYGMSLLGGDFVNTKFNSTFKEYALNTARTRREHEWMQVFPYGWNAVLKELLGDKLIPAKDNIKGVTQTVVELNTRVNFSFNRNMYLKNRVGTNDDQRIRIIQTTKEIYDKMKGSVVPSAFWNSSKDFISRGVSFSLYYDERLAATAFSSFVAPGKLELGIETSPEFRGRGLAEKVCSTLIDYCLERNLEPIWACRLENTGSFMLANRLGFVPASEHPYYRLSN